MSAITVRRFADTTRGHREPLNSPGQSASSITRSVPAATPGSRNLLVGLMVVARNTDDHELQRPAACIRERVHFAEIDRDGVAGFDGRCLGRRASSAGSNRYRPFAGHYVIEFGLLCVKVRPGRTAGWQQQVIHIGPLGPEDRW